jgi:hypothetical protein
MKSNLVQSSALVSGTVQANDCGKYRQAAQRIATSPCHARSENNTDAIQVEQAHITGWSVDPRGLNRARTGARAECFSLAEEAPHADRRTTTPERPR